MDLLMLPRNKIDPESLKQVQGRQVQDDSF